MDVQSRIQLAQTMLGLAALSFAYFYMYGRTKVDRYREDLFSLRDGLFDAMWKNGSRFDLPAYRLLRQLLNGAVRTADTLTPLSFLQFALVALRDDTAEDSLSRALSTVEDPAVRERLLDVRRAFEHRLLMFLFGEGLAGWLFRSLRHLNWLWERIRGFLASLAVLWSDPLVAVGSESGENIGLTPTRLAGLR